MGQKTCYLVFRISQDAQQYSAMLELRLTFASLTLVPNPRFQNINPRNTQRLVTLVFVPVRSVMSGTNSKVCKLYSQSSSLPSYCQICLYLVALSLECCWLFCQSVRHFKRIFKGNTSIGGIKFIPFAQLIWNQIKHNVSYAYQIYAFLVHKTSLVFITRTHYISTGMLCVCVRVCAF